MRGRLLLLLALACTVAAAVAASGHAGQSALRGCGVVTGPAYTIKGKTSTRYAVIASGAVTCAFARRWTPRLANRRPTGSGALKTITGGPLGWRCFATPVPFRTVKAVAGGCSRRTGVGFTWAPKTV